MNTVGALIDTGYPVLTLNNRVDDSIIRLQTAGLTSAPVLDGEQYVTMVSLEDLSGSEKKALLSAIRLRNVPALFRNSHLLNSFMIILESADDVIPVKEDDGAYAGMLHKNSALKHVAGLFHLEEGIATIEIEVPVKGIRVSEVIGSVEKNDASVLSFGSQPATAEGDGMIITFRVLTYDLFRLIKNLEKYGYIIRYSSSYSDTAIDELREKALEFIRYMDM
jgi:acetoin utilization protein AcuB